MSITEYHFCRYYYSVQRVQWSESSWGACRQTTANNTRLMSTGR